jgi:hypothetical protein
MPVAPRRYFNVVQRPLPAAPLVERRRQGIGLRNRRFDPLGWSEIHL